MSSQRSSSSSMSSSSRLFRSYRVTLKVRHGRPGEDQVVVVEARTQGAARRAALREHPGHIVVAVERIE